MKKNLVLFKLLGFTFVLAFGACTNRPTESKVLSAAVVDPILIRSDYSPGEVTTLCDEAINGVKNSLTQISDLDPMARNFDNTLLALESALADFSDKSSPLTFMGYVSTDPAISQEGSDCEQKVGAAYVEISTNKPLYLALKDQNPRNLDEQRLFTKTIEGFEQNGLKLPDVSLAQVKKLKTHLSGLESKFSANLNSDATQVEFTEDELEGLPADYIAGLTKTPSGNLIVTARESDASIVLPNAKRSETRKKWLTAYYNRQAVPNTKLLEAAIIVRHEIAAIMGYGTWADYRIQGRMATDAKTVTQFLDGLKSKLSVRVQQDLDKLLQFKKELDPSADHLDPWDINYLVYQLKKRDYSLDEEKIREYFPADRVVAGVFDVYSQLLGVKYTEVVDQKVWSPDVKLYKIEDSSSGTLMGYFYTDFVPRQGKYGHAAAFPLIAGRVLADGTYSKPVASIVANLAPPAAGKPSLLSHDDVVTLFHEFGHIMHQTLTRAKYASLAGSAVSQDFVEAPSQMLENWAWDPTILAKVSGHYLDPTQKLPADLLQKMSQVRNFNQGYYYMRQLLFATLDIQYHTAPGAVDTQKVFNDLYAQLFGLEPMENTYFPASFGHLMGGYDAGYYGYMWSEVYSDDMFTRFSSGGLLNPTVGGDYRQIVLANGNMKDALDLLKEFLGREPNSDAFFKRLGI